MDAPISFFERLPYELRLLVYEHAVGNSRIHIVPQQGRLHHVPCVAPGRALVSDDEETIRDECMLDKNQSQHCAIRTVQVALPPAYTPQWVSIPSSGIPLLRASKATYAEAARLVYTRNQFMMHSLGALFRFMEIVPSHRLELIQSIYVSADLNGADFVRIDYGSQGMQKLPRELAPLFKFNWFDSTDDKQQADSGLEPARTGSLVLPVNSAVAALNA